MKILTLDYKKIRRKQTLLVRDKVLIYLNQITGHLIEQLCSDVYQTKHGEVRWIKIYINELIPKHQYDEWMARVKQQTFSDKYNVELKLVRIHDFGLKRKGHDVLKYEQSYYTKSQRRFMVKITKK